MFRIIMRRVWHESAAAGTDKVMAYAPIPAGGRLNSVHMEVHLRGDDMSVDMGSMYGFSGFILPILDPDTDSNVNTVWDQLVPKDVELSAGGFDLDTTGIDITSEFEPGLVDPSAVISSGGKPREIFRRRKILSYANSAGKAFKDASPDTFITTDYFNTKVSKSYSVPVPSVAVFALSSPDMNLTTNVQATLPTEKQWTQLTYLEDVLKDAWKNLVGLTEGGAETPYAEASAFIADLLEPKMLEGSEYQWNPQAWSCLGKMTFDISVPGEFKVGSLTSE